MQDSIGREIQIQVDAFRENCKVSGYGIVDFFQGLWKKWIQVVVLSSWKSGRSWIYIDER